MQAIYPGNRRPGAHVSVTGVSHRYRRHAGVALSGINFEVQPCEAIALVGRSGCGKSTLLHIMSGLTMPTIGEVRIDGALVEGPSPRWIVMFQQPHLYPWMTVERSVGLGMKFAGKARHEIRERVRDLLDLVDLDGYAGRNVQELSGGQQQRVALARSLAMQPEILLLDEPFSALDAVTRRALQRDVRRIAIEYGITLVIVTHDIAEAVVMADRALVMASDPGRIVENVPIELGRDDRDRRGSETQLAQSKLQAAFERVVGRAADATSIHSGQDSLKIVAGHR
ncbi:MAG TPA: ATP-binding cassette domain-containing protein [Bradyrhizobium sp.]|nr:ATP-binding cassette domain-containing protein [Bradyrhizobium sp.]